MFSFQIGPLNLLYLFTTFFKLTQQCWKKLCAISINVHPSCTAAALGIYIVKPSLPPDSLMDSTQNYRKKLCAILQNQWTVEYCCAAVESYGFKLWCQTISGPVSWLHTGPRSGTAMTSAEINREGGWLWFRHREINMYFTRQSNLVLSS